MVQSKPPLDAMRNAVPGLKSAQYGNHLHTIGAVPDQMHIPGTGIVGIYREIVWKTQRVDNTDNNKRAELEAWLDKFFDCTRSTTNGVKKKPTLDHALRHFRARRSDITLFLEPQGFKKGTEGGAQVYYGLTFKPPQGTAETSSVEEDALDSPTPTLAGRHTTLPEAMASWREKGFRRRHASSQTHVVLWCATNQAKPGSDHVPKWPATVHVLYVESTSPNDVPFWQSTQGDTHGDACCYHNWDGKVPIFGNWLGDGVREIILEAYFKTNLRVQQIVPRLHDKNRCIEHYPERLSGMISNFIANVRRKLHGTGSKVTRAQLHSILSGFPRESSDDDTLILLGHPYQTQGGSDMLILDRGYSLAKLPCFFEGAEKLG